MKFPARIVAVIVWVLAIALAATEWTTFKQSAEELMSHDATYYVAFRVGESLTYLVALFAAGGVLWLLAEIRDRLPER